MHEDQSTIKCDIKMCKESISDKLMELIKHRMPKKCEAGKNGRVDYILVSLDSFQMGLGGQSVGPLTQGILDVCF